MEFLGMIPFVSCVSFFRDFRFDLSCIHPKQPKTNLKKFWSHPEKDNPPTVDWFMPRRAGGHIFGALNFFVRIFLGWWVETPVEEMIQDS